MKGKYHHAAATAVITGHAANPGSKLVVSGLRVPKRTTGRGQTVLLSGVKLISSNIPNSPLKINNIYLRKSMTLKELELA